MRAEATAADQAAASVRGRLAHGAFRRIRKFSVSMPAVQILKYMSAPAAVLKIKLHLAENLAPF